MKNASGTVRTRIKEILDQRGITLVEAARLTGLSYQTISGLNKNQIVRLGTETIAALCNGLQVQPGDLFEYLPVSQPGNHGQ